MHVAEKVREPAQINAVALKAYGSSLLGRSGV